MLYYLFDYINKTFNPPGFDIFRFLTFRSGLAAITGLFLSFYLGPKIIKKLQAHQIGEAKKADGPKFHWSKSGTPTMGGMIIVLSVVIPGLVVGSAVYFLPEFKDFNTLTTVPFLKNVNLDFSYLYIPLVVFIITATSNAVNLTDGLDGLATGVIVIVMITLALLSYFSGNAIFANYLNIIHLPGSGELTVFIAALVGAGLGFLWFNSYPAQVFMGDTGSLALGGAFGILAVLIKKELFIPILGGVFFMETLSVIIQRLYFKYTKKRFGEGKRVFKMAPVHHHFEMVGWPEPKIVIRAYIIAIILAIVTLVSFKIR